MANQLLSPLGKQFILLDQAVKFFCRDFRAWSWFRRRFQHRIFPFEILAPILESLHLVKKITLDSPEGKKYIQ